MKIVKYSKNFTEQCINHVCHNINNSDIIDDGECVRVSLMLSKYMLDNHNIILTIHNGFINGIHPDYDEHKVVIGSHMWLSYNDKKIDLTADKQHAPSTSYILDVPVKIIDPIFYVKGYQDATEDENDNIKEILDNLNNDLLTKFYQAAIRSKNNNSSIEYDLLGEYEKNCGEKTVERDNKMVIVKGQDLFDEEYRKFEKIAKG